MRIRLINQQNPKKVLNMNRDAWFRIIELAEEYGWEPLGTRAPDDWPELEQHPAGLLDEGWCIEPDPDGWDGGYTAGVNEARLVLVEDALNLADALDQALLEYEPDPVYKFEGTALALLPGLEVRSRPSLGAIVALVDFCRLGAFTLENY